MRLPGGRLTAAELEALADASAAFGSATLELTDYGNLRIRDINDAEAGLPHERLANIVASPLSGRSGGIADVRAWVIGLDNAIRTEPLLARLPDRFLFSIDDGRGDVSGLSADMGAHVFDDRVALLLAGRDTGVRFTPGDIVQALVTVAAQFVEMRGTASRVSELADPSALRLGAELGDGFKPILRAPVGWIRQDDGRVALGAAVPHGLLSARVAEFLAAIDAPLIVTPWRSILVCDLDEAVADTVLRVLAPMGLVFDENSPWAAVGDDPGS